MNPSIQLKKAILLLLMALTCLTLSPAVRAVNPPPDGGYPGGNTAEGQNALLNLTGGGIHNSAFGFDALVSQTDADFCTAVGSAAMLLNNASENTAVGCAALFTNSTGTRNNGFGTFTLFSNTEGSDNTAVGDSALASNATGSRHTAVGSEALLNCVAPPDFAGNTAVGTQALFSDTTGNFNTAVGDAALFFNVDGVGNTAIGDLALTMSISSSSTAVGAKALYSNADGDSNDAVGFSALMNNTVGGFNQALGDFALARNVNGAAIIAIGDAAFVDNVHGSFNTVIGDEAGSGVEGNDNIYIGATSGPNPPVNEDGTIRIGDPTFVGACYIAGIATNMQVIDDVNVFQVSVDVTTGQLGFAAGPNSGSAPEHKAPQHRSAGSRHQAMLNNKVEKLQATVVQQQKQIETLTAQLREQATRIQKVSAQLEVHKAAPQTVLNNQ